MKRLLGPRLLLTGAALLISGIPASAQEDPAPVDFMEQTLKVPAVTLEEIEDTTSLEIMVHRWGFSDKSRQRFRLKVLEQPDFVRRVRLSEKSMVFDENQWQRPVAVDIQVQPDALDGAGELKIEIEPTDEQLVPARRILVIPLRMGDQVENGREGRHDFVVRTLKDEPRPPKLTYPEMKPYILDEELPLNTFDPVAICFLDTLEDRKPYFYRIMGPDGKLFQVALHLGGSDTNAVKAVEDSPYDVVVWMKHASTSQAATPRSPGIYTVLVADATARHGLYGIPSGHAPGEYRPIGEFELQAPTLEFKGVTTLVFPNRFLDESFQPYLAFDPVVSSDSSDQLDLVMEWVAPEDGKGQQAARSTLNYQFPATLNFTAMGQVSPAKLELTPYNGRPDKWKISHRFVKGLGIKTEPGPYHTLREDSPGVTEWVPDISISPGEKETHGGSDLRLTVDYPFALSDRGQIRWVNGFREEVPRSLNWLMRDPDVHFGLSFEYQTQASEFHTLGKAIVVALYGAPEAPTSEVVLRERGRVMERPDGLSDPADPDDAQAGDGTTDPDGSGGTNVADNGTGGTTGGDRPDGSGTATTGGPDGSNGAGGREGLRPETLNPDQPDISALIQEWRRIAEPPQNATEGASFRYNEWGVLEGKALIGTAVAGPKPDGVGARSSSAYLWSIRSKLDSVDHCLLEEYVMAKLGGGSIAQCKGRYPRVPIVQAPGVVGRPLAAAKSKLEGLGLIADLQVGDPAPDQESEFTVQRQSVTPGSRLLAGKSVTVHLYSKYVPAARMPNLVGQPLDQATARLQKLGLSAQLKVGTPAPSAERNGTVESQQPAAGQAVARGRKVDLVLHSNHVSASDLAKLDPSTPSHETGGGVPASVSGDAKPGSPLGPSRVARIQLPEFVGPGYAKKYHGLWRDYKNPLVRGADHWAHPEGWALRHAGFVYSNNPEKAFKQSYSFGHVAVELFWLETSDPVGDRELKVLETLTQAQTDALYNRELGPGPWYFHHPERLVTVRLTSKSHFQHMRFMDLEDFAEQVFATVAPQARRRQTAYTPMSRWRFPSRVMGMQLSDSDAKLVSGENNPKPFQAGGFPKVNQPEFWKVPHRVVSISWSTRNSNRTSGRDTSGGVYGIPNNVVEWGKNSYMSMYIRWLQHGDPYSPELRRGFTGSGRTIRQNKHQDARNNAFWIESGELAARIKVYIRYDKGMRFDMSQAEREAHAIAADIFRQLKGHALRLQDIPTEPRMK